MLENDARMDIAAYNKYFADLISTVKPLGKLFRTRANGYIYDTGTSKILQCEDLEYRLLGCMIGNTSEDSVYGLVEIFGEEKVLQALGNIKDAVENEHVLQSIRPKRFHSPAHFETLEYDVNNELNIVILELTESCNLRCGYCIYGSHYDKKRDHGDSNMTAETARAAIDYLEQHGKQDEISVVFYGGEPLLRFDMLKYCINYAQKTITRPNLFFSLTTNLTLVTEEIAQYLASVKGLNITCSIDGPQEIHDSYRRDIKGNGSFDRAIKGLQYLVEAFGESAKDNVALNLVFAPPYSAEKLDKIDEFFSQLDWLPAEMHKAVTYPGADTIAAEVEALKKPDTEVVINTALSDWSRSHILKQLDDDDARYFTQSNVEDSLVKIHKRAIYTEPVEECQLNGCCNPASRRLYVTVNGDFMLCERVAGAPTIGNVYTGLDFQKLKSAFVDQYAAASISYCSKCWAMRLCSVCYTEAFTDGRLDMKSKSFHCDLERCDIENNLINYHEFMERAPEKLMFLNDVISK